MDNGQKENQSLLYGVALLIHRTIFLCDCAFQAAGYAILPHFFILVPLCDILLDIHWLTVTAWD